MLSDARKQSILIKLAAVHYHGSPVPDITELRAGSYITPDRATAELMGRYHKDTGKTWDDKDLKEPHYLGRAAKFLRGRTPKGRAHIYRVDVDEKNVDKLGNPWEHKLRRAAITKKAAYVDADGRKEVGTKQYVRLWAGHAKLNAREAVRHAKYLTDHPDADKKHIEGTLRHRLLSMAMRGKDIGAAVLYGVLPPTAVTVGGRPLYRHHTKKELLGGEVHKGEVRDKGA